MIDGPKALVRSRLSAGRAERTNGLASGSLYDFGVDAG